MLLGILEWEDFKLKKLSLDVTLITIEQIWSR